MSEKLEGAYVQAWVWVEAAEFDPGPGPSDAEKEAAARDAAQQTHHRDGELEIDDDAKVSLSYESG
ncbi:hypothetical protein LCGC14_1496780 [marine sediment metagenome]|uniref:Uncharacterized protein n=1 Tax=marine sediment metagenome TaxID=412755 RepID=A0A0F9J577_9ZZZZ